MASFLEAEYRGVSLKLNKVFVSISEDFQTPSKADGLDDYSEMALRIIGCESIQDAGKMLKLPQVAIACAQVLYHRFYFSKSFVRHNWEHYAMACVFLSAKIEECCRRLRDVVNVFVYIRQLREQKIFKSLTIPEYAELKPYIIKAERRVLKELGFCVHGKHSHKLICIYLHILGQDQNKDLVQLSWNYMNDSLRTTVFCQYQPEVIACACIYLAVVHLQFPINHNWYEIFGATEATIHGICLAILRLYSVRDIDLLSLEGRVSRLKKVQMDSRALKGAPSGWQVHNHHLQEGDQAGGKRASTGDNQDGDKNLRGGKENLLKERSKDRPATGDKRAGTDGGKTQTRRRRSGSSARRKRRQRQTEGGRSRSPRRGGGATSSSDRHAARHRRSRRSPSPLGGKGAVPSSGATRRAHNGGKVHR